MTETEINTGGLKSKHNRLNCAITKIQENMILNNIDSGTEFYKFFSIKEKNTESLENIDNISDFQKQLPKYCREFSTKKKKHAFNVKSLVHLLWK